MEKAARDAAGVHLRAGSFADLGQERAHPSGERRSGTAHRRDDVPTGAHLQSSDPPRGWIHKEVVVYFTLVLPRYFSCEVGLNIDGPAGIS